MAPAPAGAGAGGEGAGGSGGGLMNSMLAGAALVGGAAALDYTVRVCCVFHGGLVGGV